MKKYNVAVIGYGWVSTAHIQAINATSHAQVTAVYSSRPQNDAELSARYGSSIQTYTDLDALLKRPDIHAVSICSYPEPARAARHRGGEGRQAHHPRETAHAFARGREGRRRTPWRKRGVKTCVCFELPLLQPVAGHEGGASTRACSARFITAKSTTITASDPGTASSAGTRRRERRQQPACPRAVTRWMRLLFCMGGDVESGHQLSSSFAEQGLPQYEYATTSVTILQVRGRATGQGRVGDRLHPAVLFPHASRRQRGLAARQQVSLEPDRRAEQARVEQALDEDARFRRCLGSPVSGQFEAFFAALERGEDMPLTSLRESMRSHRVVLAADMSAELGREVKMKEWL